MIWLLNFIAQVGSTKAGQAMISWLASKLWNYASDKVRKELAENEWEKHVKDILTKYDAVIDLAAEKAKDGLTEEEKNDIRQKKIALETELLNARRPNP